MLFRSGNSEKVITFEARAVLPLEHPLNAYALGRPNSEGQIIPRFLVETIENDDIGSQQSAEAIAEDTLRTLVGQNVELQFDAQCIPYLEEYDRCSLEYDGIDSAFTLRQFSIPLGVGDTMSIGYNRRLATVDRNAISSTSTRQVKTINKANNEPKGKKKPKKNKKDAGKK